MSPITTRVVLPLVVLLLLQLLALHASATSPLSEGFRVDMTHVDSGGGFTRTELMRRAVQRSKHRMQWFAAKTSSAPLDGVTFPIFPSIGEYLIVISIGNPPLSYPAIADTGSDLIWAQCKPCVSCIPQTTPLFDPSTSSTFSYLPCSSSLCKTFVCLDFAPRCVHYYVYGDRTTTIGFLGNETFTFGTTRTKVSVPHVGFGCGFLNKGVDFIGLNNASGMVGLGRGAASLVSQLGVGKFSYCLTSPYTEKAKRSHLMFGALAARMIRRAAAKGAVQSTPLIRNPVIPNLYYLSLLGISIGGKRLPIPSSVFAIKKDGSGGIIIDSGTGRSTVPDAAYKAMSDAFVSQFKLPVANGSDVGYDLCFARPKGVPPASVKVPQLVFHFEGGANMVFPRDNYFLADDDDSGGFLYCLTIGSDGGDGMSFLGNQQQQNFNILYDLDDDKLLFAPAQCDKM